MIENIKSNPYVKHSWENTKMDKFFLQMVPLFEGKKNKEKIKSFDQRMKQKYLLKMGIDLEKAILIDLRKLTLTPSE